MPNGCSAPQRERGMADAGHDAVVALATRASERTRVLAACRAATAIAPSSTQTRNKYTRRMHSSYFSSAAESCMEEEVPVTPILGASGRP